MNKPPVFQSGTKTIELSEVVAFLEAPQPTGALPGNVSFLVHMFDGCNLTIRGESDSEAFTRAMDNYLGVNLT